MAAKEERTVQVGDTIIKLDNILFAQQHADTVAITFSTQPGDTLTLQGDEAKAFWEYYSSTAKQLPEPVPPFIAGMGAHRRS
jgi:hypothetical protein